jgi:cation-transporting ATPase 13A3/4/5
MSVLVRDVNDDFFKVFSKGSPEQIRDSCLKETIPPDFNEVLKKYTMKGFRVLAFSYKNVKISYLESQTIKREKLENKMIFLGLLIVQNQLKPQTAETIAILNKANIRLAMATGDYILTAISVARQCELINPESTVYNCEIIDNKLVWNHIEKFDDNDFIDENEIEEGKEFRLDTEEEEIMLGINKSYTVAKKMNFTFDKEKLEKKIKKEIKNREEKNKIEEKKEEEKKRRRKKCNRKKWNRK